MTSLTEDEKSSLDDGCYGSGEYPCLEHYLTREARRTIGGQIIPKGTRQGGEMLDAVEKIVAARVEQATRLVVTPIREAFDECFQPDMGGVDWRDDEAIQTLARKVARVLNVAGAWS